MTNFNGDSIIYDEIGNPTQYRDGMAFVWESGRRLASITQGTNSYSYSYDSSGVRISKTVNGSTYSYIYDNGQLIYADTPSGGMTFIYENDSVAGYKYGSEYYYYIKNLQGDIIGVIDKNCNLLYQYEYDAWGNHTVLDAQGNTISPDAPHVANFNPLRYRGYFFDTETGLYLTGSRYYDPVTCRFINADTAAVLTASPDSLYDKNLFAYCDNNPVTRVDSEGEFWDTLLDIVSVVVSVVDVVTNPTDATAWASLGADIVSLAVPGFTGGGAIVKAVTKADDVADAVKTVKTVKKVSKAADAGKAAKKVVKAADKASVAKNTAKVHGNSLKSTKINYGYALVDKNNYIMKFGETINPKTRYSKKYLEQNGYTMKILVSGSKIDIHNWQHDMNMYYKSRYGSFPPLNKRGW